MEKPKYFIVKTDNDNPLQKVFKQWLNTIYNQTWSVDYSEYKYYGYDGSKTGNGTDAHDKTNLFSNNPIVLTLQEWYNLFIEQMTNQTLTLEQLKELYKSDSCSDWQFHIKDTYLLPNILEKDSFSILIKQESIDLLLKRGSEIQKKAVTDLGILLENKYPKTWVELDGSLKGYYISAGSEIKYTAHEQNTKPTNKNLIPTKELAEEILQFIQLSQCYYRYVGDWKPDWTQNTFKYVIRVFRNSVECENYQNTNHFFTFPTEQMRNEFFNNFKDQLEKCKSLI